MFDWLFEWFHAKRVARMLDLKDLGKIPVWRVRNRNTGIICKIGIACAVCNSRMRLGSATEGRVFHYCWKCAKVVNSGNITEKPNGAGQNVLRLSYDDDTRASLENLCQDCQIKDVTDVVSRALALWREAVETTKSGKRLCIITSDLSDDSPIDALSIGEWVYVVDEGKRLRAPGPNKTDRDEFGSEEG